MMHRSSRPRPALFGTLCVAAAGLLLTIGAASAGAASVVGPDGTISGCYAKKGKRKGDLRVVAQKARCRKGEKRVSWNAQGQAGQTGQTGGQGGSGTVTTESRISQLETQVTQLQTQVAQLQSILAGVTNTDLLDAIGSVAKVDDLCTEMSTVVTQLNGVLSALGAPSLTGTLLGLGTLALSFPSLPAPLSAYSCP